ncbi:MAG TPA: WD40 repeat domain-containing protein [Phototrophicaceae bacterium]|nr:WD40 repeat domain-containing protein [Phototrophicaceae bacterium]
MRRLIWIIFITTLFLTLQAVAAQEAELPWCHQPSGVNFEQQSYSYKYTVALGKGPDGIRAVYQPYNQRIILMKAATREVVQVIEEGIEPINNFDVISYSPDCRYLAGVLGNTHAEHTTVVWDLITNPARRVDASDQWIARSWYFSWSPDSVYAVVSTWNEIFLWQLASNQRIRLSPDVHSDCYPNALGCGGDTVPYRHVSWDVANQLVSLSLLHETVTYRLADGQPVTVTSNGTPLPPAVQQTVIERLASPLGCFVRVRTDGNDIVLADRNTQEARLVIPDQPYKNVFIFKGWSSNCRYFAAAVGSDRKHTDTVVWDVMTQQRIATFNNAQGYTHELSWSPFGSYALIETRHGAYLWDVVTDQRTLLTDQVNSDGQSFNRWQRWDAQNMILIVQTVGEGIFHIYRLPNGELLAQVEQIEQVCPQFSSIC